MKILLIKPFNHEAFSIVSPIGLGYSATALRKQAHEVSVSDCLAKSYNIEQVSDIFIKYDPDVVGIHVFNDSLLL